MLVNVDNDTLRRLMANEKAMEALMNIEGFRALNKDIETIINKSEHVKKAKRDGETLTKKEKKELTAEEKDFNLLCSLNVFNASLMNDAVYKFKRYEDASLVYTGLESKHEGEGVGLFNTVLTSEEYKSLYKLQQESL